jgi:hypothetical protein
VYIVETGSELPDVFITYSLISAVENLHADDEAISSNNLVQISYFNRAGLNNIPNIQKSMTDVGFYKAGKRGLAYNVDTKHFGIAFDFRLNEEV